MTNSEEYLEYISNSWITRGYIGFGFIIWDELGRLIKAKFGTMHGHLETLNAHCSG